MRKAFQAVRDNAKHLALIGLMAFLIPQLLFSIIFAAKSRPTVADIKAFTLAFEGSAGARTPDFTQLISKTAPFLTQYLSFVTVIVLLSLMGFLATFRIFRNYFSGAPPPSMGDLLKYSLKNLPLRGVGFVLLTLGLVAMVLMVFPPLFFLLAPVLIAPAIMEFQQAGPFFAIRNALTLRYVKGASGRFWITFFHSVSLFFVVSLLISLTLTAGELVLQLDDPISFAGLHWRSITLPAVASALADVVRISGIVFTFFLYAAIATTVFVLTQLELSRLPRQS